MARNKDSSMYKFLIHYVHHYTHMHTEDAHCNHGQDTDYPEGLVALFSPVRQMSGQQLEIGHDHFLSPCFQFINHPAIQYYIVLLNKS
jgi:hypothetical protein